MEGLIEHIASFLNKEITKLTPVSGGDSSRTYKLHTTKKNYFLKIHSGGKAFQILDAEKKGLECIAASQTIAVPQVLELGIYEDQGFLLMEFIESKAGSAEDFQTLGYQLASMHQREGPYFGFETNNFIGSLDQTNTASDTWAQFYVEQRLQPQLDMAVANGLLNTHERPSNTIMYEATHPYFEKRKPALVHGDLWSGNFLFGLDGTPYLIDPAVYYGHCEVDIAMTRLFGGFHDSFYQAYHDILPQTSETEHRIELYQLYYLLVHLNLFGRSYYHGVRRILSKYF